MAICDVIRFKSSYTQVKQNWNRDRQIHCRYHPSAVLTATEKQLPRFVQNQYCNKTRIELRCPVEHCPFVAVGTGPIEKHNCTRCGAQLSDSYVSDRRCWKCRQRTANLFD